MRIVLALLSVVLLVSPVAAQEEQPLPIEEPASVATQEELPPQMEPAPAPIVEALPPQVAPVWIDIPRIGAHAPVVPLAEDVDGALASPEDPDTVGWYELGPGLEWGGNILLDGHVDWGGQLRVFGQLRQLHEGDVVTLTDANGNARAYAVLWTKFYADADAAPLDEIYDTTPVEQVTLITCGGAFDQTIHMYLGRWVVRALPVVTAHAE